MGVQVRPIQLYLPISNKAIQVLVGLGKRLDVVMVPWRQFDNPKLSKGYVDNMTSHLAMQQAACPGDTTRRWTGI